MPKAHGGEVDEPTGAAALRFPQLTFWQTLEQTFLMLPFIAPTIVLLFVMLLPFMLYQAWVFIVLWGWFVTPVFGGPQLQFWYAFGLLLIASLLVPSTPQKKQESEFSVANRFAKEIAMVIFRPTCSLAVGWIVKTFFCA